MRFAALLAVPALLLGLSACQEPGRAAGSRYISDTTFEDLPAPAGARILEGSGESFSYSGNNFRCGRFEYRYGATAEDAARFFKQTMTKPPYSWTLVDEHWRPTEGSATLDFNKSTDHCTIDIRRISRPGSEASEVNLLVRVNYPRN